MKTAIFTAVAAFVLVPIGCNKGPEGGATPASPFSLTGPTRYTTITQGETQNIDVEINRSSSFSDDLTLQVAKSTVPKGLEVALSKDKVSASENKVTLTLKATNAAAPGQYDVRINAKHGAGDATSVEVPVKVEPK